MPYADPESSFEAAARHLFRHSNDVNALRRNPLVRSFFASSERTREGRPVMGRIHARMLAEAAVVCAELAAAGAVGQARRRHAIVVGLCVGEPPERTAARLGLTTGHYYRERRLICTRVARALEQDKRSVRVGLDPMRLLFARAAVLLDQGCACRAVTLLEDARAAMPDGGARSAVRVELARAHASLGSDEFAAQVLGETAVQRADDADGWLHDRAALSRALLAMETGRDANAGHALEALAKRWIVERKTTEEAFDALIECGNWYCQAGRPADARAMLDRARATVAKLRHPPVLADIALSLLAARCADGADDAFDIEHHSLRDALSLSTAIGSAKGALSAICGLTVYYASIGLEGEAHALAERGLSLARTTDGPQHLEAMAVHIVVGFIGTPHWRSIDPLLFEAETLTRPGSLSWAILKHVQGSFLMRTRRYDRAQETLEKARDAAQSLGNRKLEGVALRKLALALYHRGSVDQSIECMKRSVEISERYADPNTLWRTYDAAARLLPDRRIARLATRSKAEMLRRVDVSRDANRPAIGGIRMPLDRLSLS